MAASHKPPGSAKVRRSQPARRKSAPSKDGEWFSARLLSWFAKAQRDLPWRRTRDPYAIWVSEIMLQQTQVATVINYYKRWMRLFPTVQALANAKEDAVLHAWQGLGYYSRARNLRRGAQEVMTHHRGTVPSEVSALLSLPGIGRYSAGAIASIAFDQPAPIVDGNVIRLLCRFFGLAGDPTRSPLKNEIWQLAAQLIPPKKARDFNQALMEMGATCCTPKSPLCAQCPLAARCRAHQTNAVGRFPELPARSKATHERHVALLAEKKGAFLLEQQPTDAPRWAGLWQFPHGKVPPKQAPQSVALALARAAQLQVSTLERRVSLKHTITRYRIALEAFHCRVSATIKSTIKDATPTNRSLRWVRPEELPRYALPAPHAKIARALLVASDKAGA